MKTSGKSFLKCQMAFYVFARNAGRYDSLIMERHADELRQMFEADDDTVGNIEEVMFGLSYDSIRERFGNNLILALQSQGKEKLDAHTCETDCVFGFEAAFVVKAEIVVLTRDGTPFGERAEFLTAFMRSFCDRLATTSGAHCAELTIDGETELLRYPETTVIDECEESPAEYRERRRRERANGPAGSILDALARVLAEK